MNEQEQNFLNQDRFRDTTQWYSEENQDDIELRGLEADMDNEEDYE